jgi:TonB family protein
MKYPSIRNAAAASFMLHCMFLTALFLTAKKHPRYVMPSPYTVRIVTETGAARAAKPSEGEKIAAPGKIIPPAAKVEKPLVHEPPREPLKTRVEVKPKTPPAKEKPKVEPPHELKKPALVEKTENLKKPPAAEKPVAQQKAAAAEPPAAADKKPPTGKDAAISGKQEEQVQSRIARMMVKKRIEDISKNRAIVDIKKTFQEPPKKYVTDGAVGRDVGKPGDTTEGQTGDRAGANLGGAVVNEYLSGVITHVRSNWAFPDTGDKGLSAVVAFTVKADGTLRKVSLEQSSGNELFDRSVINAINKSVPLPRPPFELDVGVRFYP